MRVDFPDPLAPRIPYLRPRKRRRVVCDRSKSAPYASEKSVSHSNSPSSSDTLFTAPFFDWHEGRVNGNDREETVANLLVRRRRDVSEPSPRILLLHLLLTMVSCTAQHIDSIEISQENVFDRLDPLSWMPEIEGTMSTRNASLPRVDWAPLQTASQGCHPVE